MLFAMFKYGTASPLDRVRASFRITPMDTGITRLKSDKYFQLAESAQLDFLIKTKLIVTLFTSGYSFVNVSQLIKFSRPIKLFSKVEIESKIIYWDSKCAYFEHAFFVSGQACGSALVKMKFKHGNKTIDPTGLIGQCGSSKLQYLHDWDDAINAI